MSKTIEVKSCYECKQSGYIEPDCPVDDDTPVSDHDLEFPAGCPLPDSKRPDLAYYIKVAETQNTPEILKAELLDLIKEIQAWTPRPDSKPYKYYTAADCGKVVTTRDLEIFNAARGLKE